LIVTIALYLHTCTIYFKDKTQNKIRWGSYYPFLAHKPSPSMHNPSLTKNLIDVGLKDISNLLGDYSKGEGVRI